MPPPPPLARVQSLFKDVANAFAATKTTGGTASSGQGGGSGVYSEGIHMPGFLVLLFLMSLNRANPKLGRVGESGESAVDNPIPDCFKSMLEKNVLKKAKRNKMSTLKNELLASDHVKLFAQARPALEKEFGAACKKFEKMPAVSLFSKVMMSRPTMVKVRHTPCAPRAPLPRVPPARHLCLQRHLPVASTGRFEGTLYAFAS